MQICGKASGCWIAKMSSMIDEFIHLTFKEKSNLVGRIISLTLELPEGVN